ncbi:uncharacterized protein LOC122261358 [Penaeus japonicus]|uniref:uncharacterized protein LOC122261358 n=1 Tax=Penaeus japonicus TaxID=27405 RepID=UPI001C713882|nr:uncharacterized protein LOC122261358 [Penaeus japonicus]
MYYASLIIIGSVGIVASNQDCLVHDLGGSQGTTRTPSVLLRNTAVLSVFYGEGISSSTSGDGGRAFEVHLQTGNETFILAFGERRLHVSQMKQQTRDIGDAAFPLNMRKGAWQTISVGVAGGWLTVMDTFLPHLVFQRHLGEVGGSSSLHVVSQLQLAVIFNCEAGCPVIASPSLTALHLPVAYSRALYVYPVTSRYVVSLETEATRAEGGGSGPEKLRLEVHRGGKARLGEWNKVQVILEQDNNEILVALEINGEVSSRHALPDSVGNLYVSLAEIRDAKFAARCKPASPVKALPGVRSINSYSWSFVPGLLTVSILLSLPLFITCCLLCWTKGRINNDREIVQNITFTTRGTESDVIPPLRGSRECRNWSYVPEFPFGSRA